MNLDTKEKRTVAEQAANWLLVLQTAGPQETAAFLKWLRASPLHVRELLVASRAQEVVKSVVSKSRIDVQELIARAKSQSNVSPIDDSVPFPPVRKRRWINKRGWPLVAAAGVAALAAVTLLAWFPQLLTRENDLYATRRGEQRIFELDDGSVVYLNTGSRMQVQYSEASRDIYLNQGQALFQVQHDAARPFRVHAASAVFQAIGTQFDVRLWSDRTTVAVVEGTVQVSSADEPHRLATSEGTSPPSVPTRITAGEGATVDAGGRIERPISVDAKAVTAWRTQRLIFHDTPLGVIASEFNRYNAAPRLVVEGADLSARQYDGSFDALRPESFLTYLANEQGVVFERRSNEVIIRQRSMVASGDVAP
jgi:transmembrane sensor